MTKRKEQEEQNDRAPAFIKKIDKTLWRRAVAQAKIDGITIGEWLEPLIEQGLKASARDSRY